MQLAVEGGTWKAAELEGDYCLVGESVAPGFDFADFAWGSLDGLKALVGLDIAEKVAHLIKHDPKRNFDDFYSEDNN